MRILGQAELTPPVYSRTFVPNQWSHPLRLLPSPARVIIIFPMPHRYGVVAYVTGPLQQFVETTRREFRPDSPRSHAHLTILPPRLLQGATEPEALDALRPLVAQYAPFQVTLGEVSTFLPGTPTVFVGLHQGAEPMADLHRLLNTGPLTWKESWPYVPHVTIVRMDTPGEAEAVLPLASARWLGYEGPRIVQVTELAFVREEPDLTWVDLGHVPLSKVF